MSYGNRNMKYVVVDIEADNLLADVTKIYCVSMWWDEQLRSTSDYDAMRKLFSREDIIFVGHNFVAYDAAVIEKILGIEFVE